MSRHRNQALRRHRRAQRAAWWAQLQHVLNVLAGVHAIDGDGAPASAARGVRHG